MAYRANAPLLKVARFPFPPPSYQNRQRICRSPCACLMECIVHVKHGKKGIYRAFSLSEKRGRSSSVVHTNQPITRSPFTHIANYQLLYPSPIMPAPTPQIVEVPHGIPPTSREAKERTPKEIRRAYDLAFLEAPVSG